VLPDVSKERVFFIVMGSRSIASLAKYVIHLLLTSKFMDLELIEMKATRLIEMSRTAYSVTQRYIPENRNLLLLVLDYLFYARLFFLTPPAKGAV